MNDYIRNVCIFVCLCDFISQLFISEKFKGIYKNISGVFIILFLVYPFGKHLVDISGLTDGELAKRFSENMKNSDRVWEYEKEDITAGSEKLLEYYIQRAAEDVKNEDAKSMPE